MKKRVTVSKVRAQSVTLFDDDTQKALEFKMKGCAQVAQSTAERALDRLHRKQRRPTVR